jgi:hypothetical protein
MIGIENEEQRRLAQIADNITIQSMYLAQKAGKAYADLDLLSSEDRLNLLQN